MGQLNLGSPKKPTKKWKLLDIITTFFFILVILFFLLVFTPLGDPLAASGRQTLLRASASDPKQRVKLVEAIEEGLKKKIEFCPEEYVDYMPCEDPKRNSMLSRVMNFYRERHCSNFNDEPLCLIPPPKGYMVPVQWPHSLHKIWHSNMPYNKIADRKGHQGWMKKESQHFIFPGGGTMFPDGAVQYIEKLKQYIPITGGVLRTALDMGCGVASFGGFLLSENITTLSFAPRDSHKAQIQFALERGVPAMVAMLGTRRLPFPAFSFDLVHCSRCLIPFTAHNASYFLEVDRVLRPGGYVVISGPPVQWAKQDKEWADLQAIARALCYELIAVDGNTVIWKKPLGDACFPNQNEFGVGLCDESDDPSYAWYFNLKKCVSRISSVKGDVSIGAIPKWPNRLAKPSSRVTQIKNGRDVFEPDARRWARRIAYYKNSLNLKLGTSAVRNIMDMNAFFGGFAAALVSDPVWVMNVVPPHRPSTLDVIFDRGFIGVYHNCMQIASCVLLNAFSTCNLVDIMVEMDRILRPEGTVVVRDTPAVIDIVNRVAHAVRWSTTIYEREPESTGSDRILVATKTLWKLDL
ncbi:hypothetical protein KSS87_010417 [Heliosperma pusillum]|nr:hypothetical protein KSS87_010417 [Heliosperma pusillum]